MAAVAAVSQDARGVELAVVYPQSVHVCEAAVTSLTEALVSLLLFESTISSLFGKKS